jgi:Tol biopolymer transport system component
MSHRTAALALSLLGLTSLVGCSESPGAPGEIKVPTTHPLLFSSNRATGAFAPMEIYKARIDATDTINLTRNAADDIDAAWSPDGKLVAFASNRSGNFDIFVMKEDGTEVRQLTTDPSADTQPRWSPDGSQIVFTSFKDGGATATTDKFTTDLFVVNADGSNRLHLTSTPRSDENSAAWSPDGKKILYGKRDYSDAGTRIGSGGLFVINADGSGSAAFVLSNPDFGPGAAAWSPDGKRIAIAAAYNKHRDFFTQTVVLVANVDGSNERVLTPLTSDLLFNYPAWSPDGTKILFTMVDFADTWGRVGGATEYDIGTVNVDGTGFTNLTPEKPTNGRWLDTVVGSPEAWRE